MTRLQKIESLPKLSVTEIPGKGRGVIARLPIVGGDLLETVHLLIIPSNDRQKLKDTTVAHYYFHWADGITADPEDWSAAVALGTISLCNHAADPTARFEIDQDKRTISLYALKNIQPGTEITIDYQCPLWF